MEEKQVHKRASVIEIITKGTMICDDIFWINFLSFGYIFVDMSLRDQNHMYHLLSSGRKKNVLEKCIKYWPHRSTKGFNIV